MNKNQLRAEYKVKRQQLTEVEYLKFNSDIKSIFFQKFTSLHGKIVHLFLPIKKRNEVDTWPIISSLRKVQAIVAVPKTDSGQLDLTNYVLDEYAQLEENEWGVAAPIRGKQVKVKEIDLVLLPLLSFDQKGYRVGYGKGFYDRFLSQCRPDTVKIGLSFFPPVHEIEDVDQYDVRMNYCITPHQIFKFA